MSRFKFLSVLLLMAFIGIGACSDDSSSPSDPAGDETAPLVFSSDPSADDSNVSAGEDVVVVFNEAMDAASATGNVTLSSGTISDLSWDDDRTLRIEHSAWAAGARVDVTLGTGLKDVAGNALELPYEFGFWVASPDVILLATDPADGATNVPRNVRVSLRFNRSMNLTTLTAATTVDDGTPVRAVPVSFGYSEGPDDQVLMTFESELAPLATITVTIGTGATDTGGQNLASETSFSFTTGSESDTTPPTLVSVVPANGSSISPSTTAIVFTFSEAIDETRLDPANLGAQFFLLLEQVESQVTFSPDGTVLTVPLPTPLPAGLPIYVLFEEFFDLAGNASTSPLEYRVDVSGSADPWPWVDGHLGVWSAHEVSVEGTNPPRIEDYVYFVGTDVQTDGTMEHNSFYEIPPVVRENWEIFDRDGSGIDFLGFGELDEGSTSEVRFDDPVQWLPLPATVGATWNVSTTFLFNSIDADLEVSGEVLAVEDLPFPEELDGPPISWIDCWKVRVEYVISSEGTVLLEGAETTWYAPTVGPVREITHDDEIADDAVYDSEKWFLPIDPESL